jgi:hypothetical protein
MTPETRVKNEVINYLKALQIVYNEPIEVCRRDAGGFNYRKGMPDCYFVYNGIHVELEFKAPNGTPSSMQLMWQRKFKEVYNIDDYIVSSLDEVKDIVEYYRQLGKSLNQYKTEHPYTKKDMLN